MIYRQDVDAEMTRGPDEGAVFGRRLREMRQQRNITQETLSRTAGLTEGYISSMERGLKIPSLTTILRLAEALKCSVTDLVSVFDKPPHARRRVAGVQQ
jgi:transcriptional regulator with XRE-family HTH domain